MRRFAAILRFAYYLLMLVVAAHAAYQLWATRNFSDVPDGLLKAIGVPFLYVCIPLIAALALWLAANDLTVLFG
jgi:hypothetical protein